MHIQTCRPRRRSGITSIEIVVSAILLAALIGFLAPIAVRLSRVGSNAKHCQIALAELTHKLDELAILPVIECENALKQLQLSETVYRFNPDAKLSGRMVRDQDGTRVELSLHWNSDASALPMTMVAWLDALPVTSEDDSRAKAQGDVQ